MHVNRFCFIFPSEAEIKPENNTKTSYTDDIKPENASKTPEKAKPSNHHQGCSNQILRLIKRSLHRFISLKHDTKHYSGSLFVDTAGVGFSTRVGYDNPRIFSYAELYVGSNGFSEEVLLGSGGFGRVYKAVLPSDNSVVAVKCLTEKGERFEKTFEAELAAVAHLRHRHLVRLRGWCVHDGRLLLVYDYMPNRSLDRVLFRRMETPAPVLSWQRREKILSGLAAALYYLHEQLENQIVHRDVKTSNVMLDSNYNAKLGDFGLARWQEHELEYFRTPSVKNYQFHLAETTKMGGTIGYLPPESFQKRGIATAKSDVFSFGVVVLEVVSGRRAVDLTYPDDQIVLLDWIRHLSDEGMILEALDDRILRGPHIDDGVDRLVHIGLLCTLHEPKSRPNMKWVMEALSGTIYGKLPDLPSFKCHPLYITLSSSNTSLTHTIGTTTTTTGTTTMGSDSLSFVTASDKTIYDSADSGSTVVVSSANRSLSTKKSFAMVETPREISFQEIIRATNKFSDSKRVAELDFGTAYYGILDDHHHVLIKRLGMKTCPALRERFTNELQNLGRLRHRNLVHLRGWCTEQGEMLVVYDYSSSRLLSNLLFLHNGKNNIRWEQRYNIIRSLARAILYLHEEWEEQVIHRSITSSAIILDPDMNPRLSSFALAEFLTRNEHGNPHAVIDKKKSVRGIFGYMSPEYMESGDATPVTDVYSFGVVVLEILTGQMAVDFRRPGVLLVKRVHEFEAQKRPYEELADWKLNGEYVGKELARVVKLGMECTRSNSELRPSMRQIVRILDGNDECFMEGGQKEESRKEWRRKNAKSLSLIRGIQALGIQ